MWKEGKKGGTLQSSGRRRMSELGGGGGTPFPLMQKRREETRVEKGVGVGLWMDGWMRAGGDERGEEGMPSGTQ